MDGRGPARRSHRDATFFLTLHDFAFRFPNSAEHSIRFLSERNESCGLLSPLSPETRRRGIVGSRYPKLAAWAANSEDPLFAGYPIPPRKGVQEAVLAPGGDGTYWLLFGEQRRLVRKISTDRGRTWGDTRPVLENAGKPIETGRDNVHLSLLHLKSGKLGIVYGGPYSRPGRDGTLLYRSSTDGGATWSPAVTIDPVFSLCRTAGARVLATGRIVVPTFAWFSPFAGGESEGEEATITVSWVFYSDDEGQTWKRSLSELFVSVDEGRMGCYSFEEPSLVELSDGRLLMFGHGARSLLSEFF